MNNLSDKTKLIIKIAFLVALALISYFFLSKYFSAESTHAESIAYLDDKKSSVIAMTATVAGASAILSIIPVSPLTPIANQLAGMTNWLLLIMIIVIMEKYILTVTGFICFAIIIPAACGLFICYLLFKSLFCRSLAIKLALFGLSIFLVVPTSVQLSKLIEQTNRDSIDQSMEVLNEDIEENDADNNNQSENKNILEQIAASIQTVSQDTIDTAKTKISNFIDSIAVLVVTSCIIPLLVILGYSLIVKMIFGIQIDPPRKLLTMTQHKSEKHKAIQE